ncbi:MULTISPECIES: restriction endonuclease subunit S [Actinomadura]|uniref:Restriction endonuclease subunit S n=1 Tax=Actinomadura yumaensis TaxID=111807 RepID=A0ABW2CKS5_9ACTN|nr:restriction endonuclease subunit S [Actinomadura sp. J1-007]MWK37164.1 hypothetical protein [Actinomadura sp. J1-007]
MARENTITGGRSATSAVIPGRWALSVGNPDRWTPSGFEWARLTEIARLESGHTPSRRNSEYWGGDIPWIGIRDATSNHGRMIFETNQTITQAGIENSSARLLPAGTVCLSRTASVGYVVTMGVPMATSQDFVNWVCGPRIMSRYLHYILMAEQESIRRFAHGSVHNTVYYPEVKAFHVCIPQPQEQERIVALLGALDDKIAVNDRIAATALDLVSSLFAESLAEDSDSSITTLGDVTGINIHKASPTSGGVIRYIDISSVSVDSYTWPEVTAWEEAPSRARRKVSAGDVIWSTVRPNRKSRALILDDDSNIVASTGFAVLTPRKVGSAFLYEVTRRKEFVTYLESVAEGSAYPAVRADRFAKAVIPMLSRSRMVKFESEAMQLHHRIHVANKENRFLAELRDALLPKLMSGQVRIRDAEKVVEDAV